MISVILAWLFLHYKVEEGCLFLFISLPVDLLIIGMLLGKELV